MDWFKLTYTVLGGLGIFFFGMKLLSDNLQAASGAIVRTLINSLTTNRFSAVFVGLVVTCIVQSSSVTTVMVIGFVNAGLMNLTQAIGIIFGANIGTTITGWIISFKVSKYGLLFIAFGGLAPILIKSEKFKYLCNTLLGVGFIFIGLKYMSSAFAPLKTDEGFMSLLVYFTADSYLSLLATIGVGCMLTFIIQSSSAMLGITIALAVSGAINFQTALALVMGENIGTTITALLAGVGANTNAKRASLAHALFNVLGVLTLTTFFWSYKELVEVLIPGLADFTASDGSRPHIAAHIAAGHTAFNVINVLIFLPFLNPLKNIVVKILPGKDKKETKHLEFFGDIENLSPAMALEQAHQEIVKMADLVKISLEDTKSYLLSKERKLNEENRVKKYEDITDNMQKEIMIFISKVIEKPLSQLQSVRSSAITRESDELESISDYCDSIIHYSSRRFDDNIVYDLETLKELEYLITSNIELFDLVQASIKNKQHLDMEKFNTLINAFNKYANTIKDNYLQRVKEGKYPPLASLTLSDISVSLRRIKNHTVNLAEAYVRH